MASSFHPLNALCIRSISCFPFYERDLNSISDDFIERSQSCMSTITETQYLPKLPLKRGSPASGDSLEKKDIEEFYEKDQNLRLFEVYKRLLQLNGHIKNPSDLKLKSKLFPRFPLRSRDMPLMKDLKSTSSKISPNIDLLRLDPKIARTNYQLSGMDGDHQIDYRWVRDCKNYEDFSKLHVAVFEKDEKAIKKILSDEESQDLIFKKDANNLTALHWAIMLGDVNVINTFLRQIKPENKLLALNMQDSRGCSVFKWAIGKEDICLIRTIFLSLTPEEISYLVTNIDHLKRSYLHYAIETGNNVIVKLLLDEILLSNKLNEIASIEDITGQTIFHLAALCLDAPLFERLLGLIPNKIDRSRALQKLDNLNQTPFHKAAIRSDANILKLILENILDEDKQRYLFLLDKDNKSALHLAMENSNTQVGVDFILEGIDPKNLIPYIMLKDNKGKIASHYLFYDHGSYNKFCCLLQKVKKCSENNLEAFKNIMNLLKEGDNDQRSLLHYVTLSGDLQMLRLIFSIFKGSYESEKLQLIDLKDKYGKTAFHYLFEMPYEVLYKKLGDCGYEALCKEFLNAIPAKYMAYFLNIKDIYGKTPFYNSIMFQNNIQRVVSLLNRTQIDHRRLLLETRLGEFDNTIFCYLAQNKQEELLIEMIKLVDVKDRLALLETRLDAIDDTLFHYLARNNQENLLIELLKLFDVNDRKHLLELENANKISVIVTIQGPAILEEKLKELLALFSEDQDFARMLIDILLSLKEEDSLATS